MRARGGPPLACGRGSERSRDRKGAVLAASVLAALAPWLASAQVFLNEQQAAKIVLADCDAISREEKTLSPDDRAAVERAAGLRVYESRYTFLAGSKQGAPCGYAVILDEIGKSEPITFMIGVTPDARVGEIALMVFRESRGAEVRDKRFTRQFKGKRLRDPIRLNQDILSYTGATLSSEAMTRGVRKALALVDHFYLAKSHARTAYIMGTLARIRIFGGNEAAAAEAAFAELRRLEDIFTTWRESELTHVNREAASRAVRVSPELFDLLEASLRYWRRYDGVFDVTVLWGRPPACGGLSGRLCGAGAVALDPASHTVRFLDPGLAIDLAGIAKGYAVEKAAHVLKRVGIQRALIDLGGSSMYALGAPPGATGWPVAIVDPRAPESEIAAVITLPPDTALSTSASYGTSQVIDPRTGRRLTGFASATAICPSGAETEAAAKALLLGVATGCESIVLRAEGSRLERKTSARCPLAELRATAPALRTAPAASAVLRAAR